MNDCNHNLYRFFSWLYMIMPFNNCNNMILIINVHIMTWLSDVNRLHENYYSRPINSILDFKIAFLQDLKKLKDFILERKQQTSRNKIQDIWRQPRLGIWADIQSPDRGVQTAAPAASWAW